jgi:chromosome segregation ATPase
MIDPHSDDFKIHFNDDEPDCYIEQEMAERKVDKLGQRLTMISILIPCIIGVIVFLAYLDVRKKYDEMKNSGAIEVQNLSSDLESRFSTLSLKFAKFEEAAGTRLSEIQNAITTAQKSLSDVTQQVEIRLNKQIANLKENKASKKDVDNHLAQIRQEVQPLQKDFAGLKGHMTKLDETVNTTHATLKQTITEYAQRFILFEETLNTLSASSLQLKSDIENVKNNTRQLTTGTISQDSLKLAMDKQREKQEQQLATLARNVEQQLSAIKAQVKRLHNLPPPAVETQKAIPPSPSPKTPAPSVKKKQGQIIEQDIQ